MKDHLYEPKKLKQLIAIAANKAEFDTKDKSDSSEYRTLLKKLTNKTTTSAMSKVELIKVLHHFQSRGFKISAKKSVKNNPPWLKKLISLWAELHERGFIRVESFSALEAWAVAQIAASYKGDTPQKLEWMGKYNYDLIERLKKFGLRHLRSSIELKSQGVSALLKENWHLCSDAEKENAHSVFKQIKNIKLSYDGALNAFDFMLSIEQRFSQVKS